MSDGWASFRRDGSLRRRIIKRATHHKQTY